MALSHRARLTLVSAGSAGLVFLIVFFVAGVGLRSAELQAALDELEPSLNQVSDDIRSPDGKPDLNEIVTASPQISVAVYDRTGKAVTVGGRRRLPRTAAAGLDGDLVVRSKQVNGHTIIVALPWARHEALVARFIFLCTALWLPLVAVVATATWIAARATFFPMEKLARDAEAMSLENLSSRLHVAGSGEYREFVSRLNRFLDKLESSVRREERFLSDAAHELRTPLTVLRGEVETALLKQRTDEEYRKTLRILHDETSRLSSLVELLLRSAEPAEDGDEGLDLAQAAERAHARWVDRFAEKEVQLNLVSGTACTHLNEPEFDVIVDNLLANALRISDPGTACEVRVEPMGENVRLSVCDHGPGVASEDRERIFDRFARADLGRSRAEGGFGIGLSLCKRIVESRGGRVWVDPNEPKGSCFRVELPAC